MAGGNSDDDENDLTAAQFFNDKLQKHAGIGKMSGEMIVSIQDLPMLVPRGKYSLDFYGNFAKLHGKTHDYKIMFKDISKVFML